MSDLRAFFDELHRSHPDLLLAALAVVAIGSFVLTILTLRLLTAPRSEGAPGLRGESNVGLVRRIGFVLVMLSIAMVFETVSLFSSVYGFRVLTGAPMPLCVLAGAGVQVAHFMFLYLAQARRSRALAIIALVLMTLSFATNGGRFYVNDVGEGIVEREQVEYDDALDDADAELRGIVDAAVGRFTAQVLAPADDAIEATEAAIAALGRWADNEEEGRGNRVASCGTLCETFRNQRDDLSDQLEVYRSLVAAWREAAEGLREGEPRERAERYHITLTNLPGLAALDPAATDANAGDSPTTSAARIDYLAPAVTTPTPGAGHSAGPSFANAAVLGREERVFTYEYGTSGSGDAPDIAVTLPAVRFEVPDLRGAIAALDAIHPEPPPANVADLRFVHLLRQARSEIADGDWSRLGPALAMAVLLDLIGAIMTLGAALLARNSDRTARVARRFRPSGSPRFLKAGAREHLRVRTAESLVIPPSYQARLVRDVDALGKAGVTRLLESAVGAGDGGTRFSEAQDPDARRFLQSLTRWGLAQRSGDGTVVVRPEAAEHLDVILDSLLDPETIGLLELLGEAWARINRTHLSAASSAERAVEAAPAAVPAPAPVTAPAPNETPVSQAAVGRVVRLRAAAGERSVE